MTNLDGLDSLATLKICVAYRVKGKQYAYLPNDIELMAQCEPVYEEWPGWMTPTTAARQWAELPLPARQYLEALVRLAGTRLSLVSVGPSREQTIQM